MDDIAERSANINKYDYRHPSWIYNPIKKSEV